MSVQGSPERVVFVCATYLPRVTGVSIALDAWTRRLAQLGTRVTVVAPEYPTLPNANYPPPVYPDGMDVVRLPANPASLVQGIYLPQSRGQAWEQLLEELRGSRAVVHGQDLLVAGTIARRIGRRCGLPVLLHCHYPLTDRGVAGWLPFLVGRVGARLVDTAAGFGAVRLARAVCRSADAVAAISPYIQDHLQHHRVAQAMLVPCGVDAPAEIPALDIRKRHAIAADAPIFLYVGRMDPDKQIDHLLEMAAHLRQREPRARLLLVGGGPYMQRYTQMAEDLRLGETVVFAGWAPYRDVWAYYAQADAFVLASPYEAQGLAAIEAQSMGLPVVAYRGGGISLAVADGRTGILTEHQPAALAEAALALWQDPERRAAMGDAARIQAAPYATDQVFPALLAAYADLMNR